MIKLLLMGLAVAGVAAWAIAKVPWSDPTTRRRAWLLAFQPLPALLLLVFGPLFLVREPYDAGLQDLMLKAQKVAIGAAIVIAVSLLAWLREARVSVLILGIVAVFAALAIAGANELIIDPRS